MKYSPSFKKRAKKSAVSDIIGNLLILAITVTLFSSVLFYVNNLPGPQNQTYADFSYEITTTTVGTTINITKNGGQLLEDSDITMALIINNVNTAYKISDGGAGDTWTIGEKWSLTIPDELDGTDDVEMMIIDTANNNVVWSSYLLGAGAAGDYAPIIYEKGIVEFPAYAGDSVHFYCKIVDYDGDLDGSSVVVDLTRIGGLVDTPLTFDSTKGYYVTSTTFKLGDTDEQELYNNQVIVFKAEDLANNMAVAPYTMVVFKDLFGSGGTIDFEDFNMNGLQGYLITNSELWDAFTIGGDQDINELRYTEFDKNETCVIIVASKLLANTENTNSLSLMRSDSKQIMSVPGVVSNEAFDLLGFYGGYNVFIVEFPVASLAIPGELINEYTVEISLKDNWIDNNFFYVIDTISVLPSNGMDIVTYSHPSYLPIYQTDYFDSDDTIYVKVISYLDSGAWVQGGGDVMIRDFFGVQPVMSTPGIGEVVSTVTPTGDVQTWYFSINLAKATQDPWNSGNNSYMLSYDMFTYNDGTDTFRYLLTRPIWVEAPNMKLDIVAAVEPPQGQSNLIERNILFYYKNDNQWYPPDAIQGFGDNNKKASGEFVKLADMNYDQRPDMVSIDISTGSNYELNIYINDGSWTRKPIAGLSAINAWPAGKTPAALAVGNIDLDSDEDVVVGFTDGTILIYRNNGYWTPEWVTVGTNSPILSLVVGDLNLGVSGNIPNISLDIIAGRGDSVTAYQNSDMIGKNWDEISFSGEDATLDITFVADDTYMDITNFYDPVIGFEDISNTYLDDGLYQSLLELKGEEPVKRYPATSTPADAAARLKDDGLTYILTKGSTLQVGSWEPVTADQYASIVRISFTVQYSTVAEYTSSSYNNIEWSYTGVAGTWQNTGIKIVAGKTNYEESATIAYTTGAPNDLTALQNLKFRFVNNATSKTNDAKVEFDYWSVNVYVETPYKLQYTWAFDITKTGECTINIEAWQDGAGASPDTFSFEYSLNGGTSWISLFDVTPAMTAATLYTTPAGSEFDSIGTDASPQTVLIRVKDSIQSASDLLANKINVNLISIETSYFSGVSVASAKGLEIADMDSDGRNEIVVVDATGLFWELRYNSAQDDLDMLVTQSNAPIGCINIGVGRFLNNKDSDYLDVVVTTASKSVIMKQSIPGTFSPQEITSASAASLGASAAFTGLGTITAMVAADVDGNGKMDFILGSSGGYIIYMRNIDNTATGWQIIKIDRIMSGDKNPYGINYLAASKLQNV